MAAPLGGIRGATQVRNNRAVQGVELRGGTFAVASEALWREDWSSSSWWKYQGAAAFEVADADVRSDECSQRGLEVTRGLNFAGAEW